MSPALRAEIRQYLIKYIEGSLSYEKVVMYYFQDTNEITDDPWVSRIDMIWADYIRKFLTEDEFKDRLQDVLD